ncbi:MAG TPA: hypothetical protein VLA78_09970, partial [Paracoccaceae bacterium]|nr:hypothetical protein [Paracoccaceae bacterium]
DARTGGLLVTTMGGQSGKAHAAEGPGRHLRTQQGELVATGPIAATDTNAPVWIEDVLDGWRQTSTAQVPARVTDLALLPGCDFTPPAQGTRVGNVRAAESGTHAGFWTHDDASRIAAVEVFLRTYKAYGKGTVNDSSDSAQAYQTYDIAVTETDRPVHLVIQSSRPRQLFNIHTAPGARLSGVSIIGSEAVAVANLPDGVPVEAVTRAQLAACGLDPSLGSLVPQGGPQQIAADSPDAGTWNDAAQRASDRAETRRAYAEWFTDQFGRGPTHGLAGWDLGRVSVIGPVPATPEGRAVFRPVAGAEVRIQHLGHLYIAGLHQFPQIYRQDIAALATQLAGGDLTAIRAAKE